MLVFGWKTIRAHWTNRSRCAQLICLSLMVAAAMPAQKQGKEAVDPFTKGDPEAMRACGIVSYGPMHWAGDHSTTDVEDALGAGVTIRWIETRHFKIGVGLKPRPWPTDKAAKADLAERQRWLRQRLGSCKRPSKLNAWFLAHVYAQRLEALYAEFCELTGFVGEVPVDGDTPTDGRGWDQRAVMGEGPFLGQYGKFCVLILDRRADLARYMRSFTGRETDEPTSHYFHDSSSHVFVTSPDVSYGALASDRAMHCNIVYGVVRNFVTGFGGFGYLIPVWNVEGPAHWFRRRLDDRFNSISPLPESQWSLLQDADWQAKARARVNTGAFDPGSELMLWYVGDIHDFHRHVMMWSRFDFLMSLPREKYGTYLRILKDLIVESPADKVHVQQERALLEAYGLDTEAFDEQWKSYVLKNYKR
jgi:hypothetical protein